MQKIQVSDQYVVGSVTERRPHSGFVEPLLETALQHVNLPKLSARVASGHGIIFCELPVTGLLIIRTKQGHDALKTALKSTLKMSLPRSLQSDSTPAYCIRWIAPDEWMLTCPIEEAFDIETNVRSAFGDHSLSIVNASGGFTVMRLSGENANALLKKSTAYDVHPSNFPAGKVVNTVLAKAQVTLRCVADDEYELIVRRSFADYLWHWIQVSSVEYGLGVKVQ